MLFRNRYLRKGFALLLTLSMALSLSGFVSAAAEDPVTRESAVQDIYDYFNWSHHDEYNDIWAPVMDHFTDVSHDSHPESYLAIECALQQGIVPKTDEFRPDDSLTFAEALSMLTAAFGVTEEEVQTGFPANWTRNRAITEAEWAAVLAHMKNDFVSPVQALPIAADINGEDSFAPRRYVKFWTPTEDTTIYFRKTFSTEGYNDDFEIDLTDVRDDQPSNHASNKTAAVDHTQIYTIEDDGHIKEDYSVEHMYVSYKVMAVDANGKQSAVRTYHYHLHRPSNTGTEPENGYHIEKVLEADALGQGSPEVWQICRDAESLRAMAWYIKGSESGILMDALQQHAYTADGGWSLKDAADSVADGQPYVLVVGHAHPDHAAQAAYFVNAGIPVYANERGFSSLRSYVDDTQNPRGGKYTYKNGSRDATGYLNEALIRNIEVGDQLSTGTAKFDVYALPGHLDGLVILAERQFGMVFATDLYGCTRAGSADNVAVNGVAADLLLTMAQQVRTAYEEKGAEVKVVFTGHDELPLDRSVLVNFEQALQNIIDNGNAAFTPTLRGGNNGFHAPTSLIGDMWKDYKDWISLQTGNLSTSANTYMKLTEKDAELNANIDYQDAGNKAGDYSNETHSYNTDGEKYKTYSVLSNVVVTGGELEGVDIVYKAPTTITWANESREVPFAFHNMFNPWHYDYNVKIENASATVSLDLTTMSTKAKVTEMTLDGKTVASLQNLKVKPGSVIGVKTLAQDGVTASTYTFTVTRETNPALLSGIKSIQATVIPSFYGYKVGKIDITYAAGTALDGASLEDYAVYDRGFNNPMFGALKLKSLSVRGNVVTLTVDEGTDKVTDRSRETYGTLCTSSNWYIDNAGKLHYGKTGTEPLTDQLGVTFELNTINKGLQWRKNLDLILCVNGADIADGIRSTDGLGKWIRNSKWIEPDLGVLDEVELEMVDIGRKAPNYTLLGSKGQVPVHVIFPRGYSAKRSTPYPAVVYQCGGGVCYWEVTEGSPANNLGCNVVYDTMMSEWHEQWPEAIIMSVNVHSTPVEDSAAEIADVLRVAVRDWNVDKNAITIVGNSQGTLIASDVIRQAPQYINAYVECNGNFGVMTGAASVDGTLEHSSLGKWTDAEIRRIVNNEVAVWMFNGETDGDNPAAQQDVIEVYKELYRDAGKSENWIKNHVRASGLQSWQFKAWGETDHSVTKVVAWKYLDKPYNDPNDDGATLSSGAKYKYAGKEENYKNYEYTLDYEYTVYPESVAEWAKLLVPSTNQSGSSSGGGGGSASTTTTTTSIDIAGGVKNGTVRLSTNAAKAGERVGVMPKPSNGYKTASVAVTDAYGNVVPVAENTDGTYAFVMPAGGRVTVTPTFEKVSEKTFTDVPKNIYYADAVAWAVAKGVTNGTSSDKFSPNQSCTRAHAVTFLYRAAGEPATTVTNTFADVPANSYYAKAVSWAVANGITNGTGKNTFSPDDACTRAHIVTMLSRFAKAKAGDSAKFTDVKASDYFAGAVGWAVAQGITNGTSDTTFSPNQECPRAQIVTFLNRYFTK